MNKEKIEVETPEKAKDGTRIYKCDVCFDNDPCILLVNYETSEPPSVCPYKEYLGANWKEEVSE